MVFTRFYNLPNTARLGEDESGFLVRVHQIYKEKKITLVGQVNQFGTKVFSSLTVYLLLPVAVLGNFSPISIFYGAALWGIAAVFLLLYLTHTINKRLTFLTAVLLLVSFPLVQMGRWAWNPNFIPLWVSLGLIFYLRQNKLGYFLTGIFFGLSVHQHYYAIFACSVFIIIISFKKLIHKHFQEPFLASFGFALVLIPFIIFDLRHPPGIFILGASQQTQGIATSAIFRNFLPYLFETVKYQTQNSLLAVILTVTLLLLLFRDLTSKSKALLYFSPIPFQTLFISALNVYFPHYFFVIIPFFFVWLVFPRQNIGRALSVISLCLLIIGGILSLKPQLTASVVEPDIRTVTQIDRLLKEQLRDNHLRNVNIAVLDSPDRNVSAQKFRYLLLVPDNLSVMSHDDYSGNDFLFVISTASEAAVRRDPAMEINNFRAKPAINTWHINPGPWQVYLFGK